MQAVPGTCANNVRPQPSNHVAALIHAKTEGSPLFMADLLRDLPLSHLHVFPYSDRPGTDAELIGEDSRHLGYFYKRDADDQPRPAVRRCWSMELTSAQQASAPRSSATPGSVRSGSPT